MSRKARAALMLSVLLVLALAVLWAWRAGPSSNTVQTRFDVILVLGTPTLKNGGPSTGQKARVLEGVEEWRKGVAPRIVVSGSAAHNQFIEADSMAMLARQWGVPAEDVIEEPQALNTIQNVYYTVQIMQAHGWKSAEVVSTWDHVPRAALILAHFPIEWRTHVAPWPAAYGMLRRAGHSWAEAVYCMKLKVFGFPKSRFIAR